MLERLTSLLLDLGLNPSVADMLTKAIAVAVILLLSVIANQIARRFFISIVSKVVDKTKTAWDDMFVQRKFFNRLARFAPAFVIYLMIPQALPGEIQIVTIVRAGAVIYMLFQGMLVIDSLLDSILDIYHTFAISKEMPIKSFVQVLKIIIYFLGGIIILSTVLGKTPRHILTGLGAMTVVLMLIFKDAILGFVAGIQLTANKMVANGDWIEMPKYGADGDVVEVTLTTVKVQNWDKTITTIPTYALISESFKNWRGMQESAGRRIKRSIQLDMNSIKFCTAEMIDRFSKIQFISEYIEKKKEELSKLNREAEVDDSSLANGRRMTNIGTYRAYIQAYLRNHPMISQEMTFLVRHLKPTEHGLPIEIYVFSRDKVWANYEVIQADIFDHLLAVLPEFDLSVFQFPAGSDVKRLLSN